MNWESIQQWSQNNPQASTAIGLFVVLALMLAWFRPFFVMSSRETPAGLIDQELDWYLVGYWSLAGTALWWAMPHILKYFGYA